MLGGLDPIIIFHRYKKLEDPTSLEELIAVVSKKETYVPLPPIPLYLSAELTGIQIVAESKNIDIETETQTFTDGTTANVNQKGINSGVSIDLEGKKDSVGLILLSSFMDTLFDKVTSKEYAITYLHGPITVFFGLLHSFTVSQDSSTDLLKIKIELSKGTKQPTKPPIVAAVPGVNGVIP